MLAIIFTVLFSVLVAYFATQNTTTVTLHFVSYSLTGIPIYLLVLASLLGGLLFAWILHLLNSISSSFALRGKNKTIKKGKVENLELTKKVHQLEIENTKLSTKDPEKSLIEDKSL
jgi:uncharacterized integral membrane protein